MTAPLKTTRLSVRTIALVVFVLVSAGLSRARRSFEPDHGHTARR